MTSGIFLALIIELMIAVTKVVRYGPANLRFSDMRPSSSLAFLFLSFEMAALTSKSVMGTWRVVT